MGASKSIFMYRQKRRAAVTRSRLTVASMVQALFLVADSVDRADPVSGHEYRAVLGQHDIGRPTKISLITFEPTGSEHFFLGVFAVRSNRHAHNPGALVLMAIPGAMLGDENAVLVLGGELVAGIELHSERSHMGAEI